MSEFLSLNESLAFLLNRSGTAVARAFSQELKLLGLTLPMWRVLASLWGRGEQNLGNLAESTSVEMSTLSRQVSALVKKGLILRGQSGVDWRAIKLALTPAGRRLVEDLLPAVERHELAALDGIGPSDVRRLKALLAQIYDNLEKLDSVIPRSDPA